jgi:hypothetical protein
MPIIRELMATVSFAPGEVFIFGTLSFITALLRNLGLVLDLPSVLVPYDQYPTDLISILVNLSRSDSMMSTQTRTQPWHRLGLRLESNSTLDLTLTQTHMILKIDSYSWNILDTKMVTSQTMLRTILMQQLGIREIRMSYESMVDLYMTRSKWSTSMVNKSTKHHT